MSLAIAKAEAKILKVAQKRLKVVEAEHCKLNRKIIPAQRRFENALKPLILRNIVRRGTWATIQPGSYLRSVKKLPEYITLFLQGDSYAKMPCYVVSIARKGKASVHFSVGESSRHKGVYLYRIAIILHPSNLTYAEVIKVLGMKRGSTKPKKKSKKKK